MVFGVTLSRLAPVGFNGFKALEDRLKHHDAYVNAQTQALDVSF